MALQTTEQTEVLFKSYLNVPYNLPQNIFAIENKVPFSNYVFNDEIIPINIDKDPNFTTSALPTHYGSLTKGSGSGYDYENYEIFPDNEPYLEKFTRLKLTNISGAPKSFYKVDISGNSLLKDAFQLNYGVNNKFFYSIFADNTNILTNSDFRPIFDIKSGYVTFFGTVPSGDIYITFVRYIGPKGVKTDANTINITPLEEEEKDNNDYFPTFVKDTSGNQIINIDSSLKYNPSTNSLTFGNLDLSGSSTRTIQTVTEQALELGTNSQPRVRITSGGNVGIGKTTDINAKLDVNGNVSVDGNLILGTTSKATIEYTGSEVRTYTIPNAGGNADFVMTQGNQIISGNKTFIGNVSVSGGNVIGNLTGNSDTSTKLQDSRTLWGQSFNGTADVSGNLTSVGNITGSGAMTIRAGTSGNNNVILQPNGTGIIDLDGNTSITGVLLLGGVTTGKAIIAYPGNLGSQTRYYTIRDAGDDADFVMTRGNQTISGTKAFNGNVFFLENIEITGEVSATTTLDIGSKDSSTKNGLRAWNEEISTIDNSLNLSNQYIEITTSNNVLTILVEYTYQWTTQTPPTQFPVGPVTRTITLAQGVFKYNTFLSTLESSIETEIESVTENGDARVDITSVARSLQSGNKLRLTINWSFDVIGKGTSFNWVFRRIQLGGNFATTLGINQNLTLSGTGNWGAQFNATNVEHRSTLIKNANIYTTTLDTTTINASTINNTQLNNKPFVYLDSSTLASIPKIVTGADGPTNTGSTNYAVVFPSAFTTTPFVTATVVDTADNMASLRIRNVSTTGFQIEARNASNSRVARTFNYIAIGN
jgi:hypothetical protein